MDRHFSRDQIAEWMIGGDDRANDSAAIRHFDTCEACRFQVNDLRQTFDQFRDSVHAAAQRDDLYWRRQQASIAGKLSSKGRAGTGTGYWNWYRAAAASLVLTGALVAAMLWPHSHKPVPAAATDESDTALLQSIQNDLGLEYPRALAPAVLITNERNEMLIGPLQQKSASTQDNRSQEKSSQ